LSVLNDGLNLPGSLIDYERESTADFDASQFGSTESILIVGTAFSGTPEIIFPVYGIDHAKYIYGDTYDSDTRKTATLTAGVQDAWEKGCRTIYAMRLGGKDIYKDFKLRDTENLFLRVKGLYPENELKNCYMRFDNKSGLETISFYKTIEKATVSERKNGIDSTEGMLVTTINLNQDNGLTANSVITELINTFNNNVYNNVLRLSIVDADGVDVTETEEAMQLCIGSLFPGVYFIGREMSLCQTYTQLSTKIVLDDSDTKPYSSFSGSYYKTLLFNSDIEEPYPIYASSYKELREVLKGVSITSSTSWDFLETNGLVDRAFKKDTVDYSEVDMSKFEIYKRLGSGYTVTAQAIDRGYRETKVKVGIDDDGNAIYETKNVRRKPRVIETPDDDDNKVQYIDDGAYLLMQDSSIKFRVITCANADDKIADKIPTADDFKVSVANSIELLGAEDGEGALITATPKVESDDLTLEKSYTFKFVKIDEKDIETDVKDDIYAAKVAEVVPSVALKKSISNTIANLLIAGDVKSGTKVAVVDGTSATLVRITSQGYEVLNSTGLEGELLAIDDVIYEGKVKTNSGTQYTEFDVVVPNTTSAAGAATYNNKEYILLESADHIFVGQILDDATQLTIEPLGDLDTMLNGNDDETLIYCENNYFSTNRIIIKTADAANVTLEDFVALLNEHTALSSVFDFELSDEGYTNKDEYLEDVADVWDSTATSITEYHMFQEVNGVSQDGILYALTEDKAVDYDFSAYIPYKTNDNFARQLAQHCAYTSLKTGPTHGVIGISKTYDFSQKSISQKVSDVNNFDFNMYVKSKRGRNVLDSDSMPYPIGCFVSVTMFQDTITDDNSFSYISNGASAYAGMITTLPLTQSSTAQEISLNSLNYTLTRSQLLTLSEKGIVTARNNDSMTGVVITDGITMAPSDELKRRLMVQRVLGYVGERIRLAGSPFIGKQGTPANKASLKTAIDSELKTIKDAGYISGYDFVVSNLDTYSTDTNIDITYEIVPVNEIRSINNSITISRSLSSAS
jgi:hypothetical protein